MAQGAANLLRNTADRLKRRAAACAGDGAGVGMAARNQRREEGVRGGRNRPGVEGSEETSKRESTHTNS